MLIELKALTRSPIDRSRHDWTNHRHPHRRARKDFRGQKPQQDRNDLLHRICWQRPCQIRGFARRHFFVRFQRACRQCKHRGQCARRNQPGLTHECALDCRLDSLGRNASRRLSVNGTSLAGLVTSSALVSMVCCMRASLISALRTQNHSRHFGREKISTRKRYPLFSVTQTLNATALHLRRLSFARFNAEEVVVEALDGMNGRVFHASLCNLADGGKRNAAFFCDLLLRNAVRPQISDHNVVEIYDRFHGGQV